MMTKLKIIFTFLLITLVVSIAAAQGPPSPNEFVESDNPQNRNQFIAQELNLTKEQKQQWRQINRQGRLQTREVQQRLKQAKDELDQLIYSDTVDEAILHSKLRSVVEAQAEITKIRAMSELSVRNILSPEQLVKFRNLRERFKTQQKQRLIQRQRRQRLRRLNNDRRNPNRQDRPPQRNNRRQF